MHRQKLLGLLKSYNETEEESCYKKRFIEFIAKNSNCFDRSNAQGHVTGSAWLLNSTNNKALLMHHAKLDIWVQPGGHADGMCDILQVALKEAKEESGIKEIVPISEEIFDIDIHNISAKGEAEHLHYDVRFLLKVVGDDSLKANKESKELRWISGDVKQLPTQERSVVRMFEKWQKI